MSFYRYTLERPNEKGHLRSLIPLFHEIPSNDFFSYRYYTSEKDDSPHCHVISLGYERRWPEKSQTQKALNRFIIHYAVKGKALFCDKPVRAGQFFFIHPSQEYDIRALEDDPLEFYYIGIAGPGTEMIMKNAGFLSLPDVNECPFIDKIPDIFVEPLSRTNPDSDPDYYLMSVFLRLIAMHKAHNIAPESTEQDNAFFYYKHALIYIQEYLLSGITPLEVARYLHISPSYLRVIFAKYCKYSLREFLIRKRIEYAANQLTFGQCSVTHAAAIIGYDDYTQFTKIFKKYMGMSPKAYKKAHQNDTVAQNELSTFAVEEEL